METQIIAIDGPASSGKSSVGLKFAKRIGFRYIDSGSVYRVGCYFAMTRGVAIDDPEKIVEVFKSLKLGYKIIDDHLHIFADGMDVTDQIHTPEVSQKTSIIAAYQPVREIVTKIQQILGKEEDTVITGRATGTEVFPDAILKFILTATSEERAKRRYNQVKGTKNEEPYEKILEDIIRRDHADSTREHSPYQIPEGATVIDTTNLTIQQSVDLMYKNYLKVMN